MPYRSWASVSTLARKSSAARTSYRPAELRDAKYRRSRTTPSCMSTPFDAAYARARIHALFSNVIPVTLRGLNVGDTERFAEYGGKLRARQRAWPFSWFRAARSRRAASAAPMQFVARRCMTRAKLDLEYRTRLKTEIAFPPGDTWLATPIRSCTQPVGQFVLEQKFHLDIDGDDPSRSGTHPRSREMTGRALA